MVRDKMAALLGISSVGSGTKKASEQGLQARLGRLRTGTVGSQISGQAVAHLADWVGYAGTSGTILESEIMVHDGRWIAALIAVWVKRFQGGSEVFYRPRVRRCKPLDSLFGASNMMRHILQGEKGKDDARWVPQMGCKQSNWEKRRVRAYSQGGACGDAASGDCRMGESIASRISGALVMRTICSGLADGEINMYRPATAGMPPIIGAVSHMIAPVPLKGQ
jgi:hypothetical protein